MDPGCILSVHDVSNIYHVPLILHAQGLHSIIRERMQLQQIMTPEPILHNWREMAQLVDTVTNPVVQIAIVGKYTGQPDAYLSVMKSLKHSGIALRVDVTIRWIEASDLESDQDDGQQEASEEKEKKRAAAWAILRSVNGLVSLNATE